MIPTSVIVLVILISTSILLIVFSLISYSIHKGMTNDGFRETCIGTFKDFVYEFNRADMKASKTFNGSYFSEDRTSIFHASIIKFNGKKMQMKTVFDWVFVSMYMKEYKRRNKVEQKQWNR